MVMRYAMNRYSEEDSMSKMQEQVVTPKRKYRMLKRREKWGPEEHRRFLDALELHGRDWMRITQHVGTKSRVQVRSHAQKYFLKLEKLQKETVTQTQKVSTGKEEDWQWQTASPAPFVMEQEPLTSPGLSSSGHWDGANDVVLGNSFTLIDLGCDSFNNDCGNGDRSNCDQDAQNTEQLLGHLSQDSSDVLTWSFDLESSSLSNRSLESLRMEHTEIYDDSLTCILGTEGLATASRNNVDSFRNHDHMFIVEHDS